MSITTTTTSMSGAEIVSLSKQHTIYEWSAQNAVDPIPVARAKGIYFWTPEGRRYIDFNAQLMCVNIGHGDERVTRAIAEQAAVLPYASPFMATEARAKLGARLAQIAPGDIDVFFFTNGGAEANENAIKVVRSFTGRHKILARYRSYHGGTSGAMMLTGDPRRWLSEPGMPGIVHFLDPYHGPGKAVDTTEQSLAMLEEIIQLEGPNHIAAIFLETVSGTNGILIPPDGYMQGVRELCTKYGILMVCDEVMAGFGRTGEWFAINHWNVVPDIITMAKGLTSGYVPMGAVGMRRAIAESFKDKMFPSGLTYNSHTLAAAAALANLDVYDQDDLIGNARRLGKVMAGLLADLKAKHQVVGAVRNIGLFGIVELMHPKTGAPLAPFGGTSDEMKRLNSYFREEGLYTFVRWHTFFTNPPLCITEEQLREAFAILDRSLARLAI
jgi:taurine--2-oxoglutarate transaminase